jgi:WD40 repeat protein
MSNWLGSLSDDDRDYALKHLPSHMAEAGHEKTLFRFLTDFDFIEAKVSHPDIKLQELIEDYDRAFEPKLLISGEKAEILRLIQGALRVSAHVLDKDKTQLAGQLLGRLLSFEAPEILALLEQAKQWKAAPWLCPLRPGLTPLMGALLRILTGHNSWVYGVAITPDGQQAVSASFDHTLKVWDLHTGVLLRTLIEHTKLVSAVAITPNGQQAVSASVEPLIVSDLHTGTQLRSILTGHTTILFAVAITPNGQQVVSAGDNTLKVWDLHTGAEVRTLTGHIDWVQAVAITPDGKQIVSASRDNTLKVWDLESGELVASFYGDGALNACAVAPDGVTIVAGEASGRVHFLRLEGVP